MKKILNSKGEPIVLNEQERYMMEHLGAQYNHVVKQYGVKNALGYEIVITSLTTIMKKITEQKFYEVAPADYIPLRVGEGAWSSNLVTYREFPSLVDDFSTGFVNTGANNSRMASADTGVDSLSIQVRNWVKGIGWSIMDLEQAAKSGNWDLVTSKERARKTNWDLGIQKIAFLGDTVNGVANKNMLGLYNQNLSTQIGSQIKIDTTTLTQAISSLDAADLSAFTAAVLNVYRANCARTAWPTHFIIPESDYLGLATPSSSDFPIKSKLQLLQETFQTMTRNKNFQILPSAYGDKAYSGATVQQYVLLNYAEESIRMDIPVDYTNTLANSIDNFSFQNAGYGQLSGVLAYRPLELYYFQF